MEHSLSTLIIGYGNILRGDDGAGYFVAETVANWQIPHIRSLPTHQLLPEHAAAIAQVERVIFVDAVVGDRSKPEITLEPMTIGDAPMRSHYLTPQLLLSLTQKLYHAKPDAYLLTIPAADFTLGAELSAIACQGINLALDRLKHAIADWGNDA
jgi:hydrogenase maturation protease